jgi:hypothetical protein
MYYEGVRPVYRHMVNLTFDGAWCLLSPVKKQIIKHMPKEDLIQQNRLKHRLCIALDACMRGESDNNDR